MTEIREPSEALSKIAQELCAEFPGVFCAQTVERFVFQSFRDLARTSTIHTYLHVLTQKSPGSASGPSDRWKDRS